MDQLAEHDRLPERPILLGVLAVVGLQMIAVQAFSILGVLPYQWLCALPLSLVGGALTWRLLRRQRHCLGQIREAWQAPWPWIIAAMLLAQIILYPPVMHDSLSYRLPRIFLALQEGAMSKVDSTDPRMSTMPWGWESLALPFATLNVIKLSKLIGLCCWLLTYQMLFRFARLGGAAAGTARWISLAFATAPFFLLQASATANDLLAACLLLIGISLMVHFHHRASGCGVLGSLLALVMAANVKPQFLVLGLPWLIWWAFAPGRPWQQVKVAHLLLAAPLFCLVSPFPVLIGNLMAAGTLSGVDSDYANLPNATVWQMMIAGTIQFITPQLQLPLNPWSESLSSAINALPGIGTLGSHIPKFGPAVGMMQIIDNASFGLLHSALLCLAWFAALRNRTRLVWLWTAAILLAFLLACSQVVVTTMARSFAPFVVILLPIAVIGSAQWFEPGRRRWLLIAVLIAGLASLALNPSAPLWPARSLHTVAEQRQQHQVAKQIEQYLAYQARSRTGSGILEKVPAGEAVGVLVRHGTPVASLWQPDWRDHRIIYMHDTPAEVFQESPTRWLLIADNFGQSQPQQFSAYENLEGWSLSESRDFLPNLTEGRETWRLLTRSNVTN